MTKNNLSTKENYLELREKQKEQFIKDLLLKELIELKRNIQSNYFLKKILRYSEYDNELEVYRIRGKKAELNYNIDFKTIVSEFISEKKYKYQQISELFKKVYKGEKNG